MYAKELELYIHIPFCYKKCDYCDFLSFQADKQVKKLYVEQLVREIEEAKFEGFLVSTIFLGGGTPSSLPGDEMLKIMEAVRGRFRIAVDAEITIEANPGTLNWEKLMAYQKAGINRLSMGLQSADNRELRLLGRIHTYEEFRENYKLARKAGFRNINIDLMSALPGQTASSWRETLKKVLELEPEHISAYSLIIEEGTPFYEKYELDERKRQAGEYSGILPSEEEERRMYEDTSSLLEEKGYRRYEISNYAKEGYACRHNCGYWKRADYLGMGLGAASLVGHERFCNTSDLQQYLKGDFTKENREVLTREAEMEEFMFLGLRLSEGIEKEAFLRTFGICYDQVYGELTEKLTQEVLLETVGGRVRLTEKGTDVSNYVMAQFLL